MTSKDRIKFVGYAKDDFVLNFKTITTKNLLLNLGVLFQELKRINKFYKTSLLDYFKYQFMFCSEVFVVRFEKKDCLLVSYYHDKKTNNVWFHVCGLKGLETIEPGLRQYIKEDFFNSFKAFCTYSLGVDKLLITIHKKDRETSIASKRFGFSEVKDYNQNENLGYLNVR